MNGYDVVAVFILVVVTAAAVRADVGWGRRHVEAPATPAISRAAFDVLLPARAKGVLVLVPGANGDGCGFLGETNWTCFAEKRGWAVVAATFASPERLLKRNAGYYDVAAGSGDLLLSALEDTGLDALPLYLFGFSGGARFVAGFALAHPSRVAGWAAQSPSDAVAARGGGNPPGIVACGAEDARLGACLSWFKDLRRFGKWVTWVEVPGVAHARSPELERFVRIWFAEESARRRGRDRGVWVDLGDGLPIDGISPCSEANRCWLPSRTVYSAWREMAADGSRRISSRRILTQSPKCPSLTLYLSRPQGATSNVLCLSLLANRASEVEWRLRSRSRRGTVGRFLDFADSNRLAVVAWGAPRGLWRPRRNWDGVDRGEVRRLSSSFGHVAKGWEKAMDGFSEKFGVPRSGCLMAGFSGAAQFAQRLALHCPDRFRAVAVHVASSYDYPLPAGGRILWCVTTGENESGYERSLRFLDAAKRNGYAVVYKAYPGLGHEDSVPACLLACACFRHVLAHGDGVRLDCGEWPFVVDVVNQTCGGRRDRERDVPLAFRAYLPDERVAAAWMRY